MVSSFRKRLAINSSKAGAYGMKHGCLSPEGGIIESLNIFALPLFLMEYRSLQDWIQGKTNSRQ